MRSSLKHPFLTTIIPGLALTLATVSCGIDKKPHYHDKNFGRTSDDVTESGDNETTVDPSNPEMDPPADREPESPKDKLLSHYGLMGRFNMDSVHRMFRGADTVNGQISTGGALDDALSQLLGFVIGEHTRESLEMTIRQNGEGQNIVTQDANSGGGDNISTLKGEESQSGVQIIFWALPGNPLSASCPGPFVCAERIVWVPKSGGTMTYCYRDHGTKKPIVIPYAPNPHFSVEAYKDAIGDGLRSTPIEVVTHPGNVACDNPEIETRDVNLVSYQIKLGDASAQHKPGFLQRAIFKPLKVDAEVIVDYSLWNDALSIAYLPKTGPYIDQLARLNSRMRYFVNSSEHAFVKIDRTVQSPMKLEGSVVTDFIRQTYGTIAADLVDYIFPRENDVEGVELIYSFEFCSHLGVVANAFNHCTGRSAP
jgi:hypothetical protein